MEYVYTRKRGAFGKPCTFEDEDAVVLHSVPSDTDMSKRFVTAAQSVTTWDCAPLMSTSEVNTTRVERTSTGFMHAEGGWSEGIDTSDPQQTTRFRHKVQRSPAFASSLARSAEVAAYCLRQNGYVDLYETYFESSVDGSGDGGADGAGTGKGGGGGGKYDRDFAPAKPSLHVRAVLRDPSPVRRPAVGLCWHPIDHGRIAVAYCNRRFQHMEGAEQMQSHVWDTGRPDHPQADLLSRSPLCCLAFHPSHAGGNMLAAGLHSGIVAAFDTRAGSLPTASSNAEHAHHDPVTGVQWLVERPGLECVSVSTDGFVLWWDARKLAEPLDKQPLLSQVMAIPMPEAAGQADTAVAGSSSGAGVAGSGRASLAGPTGLIGGRRVVGGTSVASASLAGVGCVLVSCEHGVITTVTRGGSGVDADGAGTEFDAFGTTSGAGASGGVIGSAGDGGGAATSPEVLRRTSAVSTAASSISRGGASSRGTRAGALDHGSGGGQPTAFVGHAGPVWAVRPHPMHPRFFLSAGDWTTPLWSLSLSSPILAPAPRPAMVTDARWSPSRAGVFFATRDDGVLEAWDLLASPGPYAPTLTYTVSAGSAVGGSSAGAPAPLLSLAVERGGGVLAVGDEAGSTTVLSVGRPLAEAQPDERGAVSKVLSRLQDIASTAAMHRARMLAEVAARQERRAAVSDALGADTGAGAGAGAGGGSLHEEHTAAFARAQASLRRRPPAKIEEDAERAFAELLATE